ncbi:hypothetical protein [Ruminiclostridium hungatei]|nr:hypothetical protein [Ruminiclostridium hungatei]
MKMRKFFFFSIISAEFYPEKTGVWEEIPQIPYKKRAFGGGYVRQE